MIQEKAIIEKLMAAVKFASEQGYMGFIQWNSWNVNDAPRLSLQKMVEPMDENSVKEDELRFDNNPGNILVEEKKRKPYACCSHDGPPIEFDTYEQLKKHNVEIHGAYKI
jgi:hypothetical protein